MKTGERLTWTLEVATTTSQLHTRIQYWCRGITHGHICIVTVCVQCM